MMAPDNERNINQTIRSQRDMFLSHRSNDKAIVRRIASSIEDCSYGDRNLLSWYDEAEIQSGESIVAAINAGLETSRFFGIMMSPSYFESQSGWTDAEWHAALFTDPDNRRSRIIPILIEDCPYIPMLLRHLSAIDMRGNAYDKGLQRLLARLRDEPLPRPITHRGELIRPGGVIDRASVVAVQSAMEGNPDIVDEHLYCNLLPILQLPVVVYSAPISQDLLTRGKNGSETMPSKKVVKDTIYRIQDEDGEGLRYLPVFKLHERRLYSFEDPADSYSILGRITDSDRTEELPMSEMVIEEEHRQIVVALLNMCISRHAVKVGLVPDDTKKGRFFFPPYEDKDHEIIWKATRKTSKRTVAKACYKDGELAFWRHLGAYLKVFFLANRFYLQIEPTWVITSDGKHVRGGPRIAQIVNRWTGPERNLHVLYHVRFWTSILRGDRGGKINIRAGNQSILVEPRSARIDLSFGIADDQKDLDMLLDEEAPLIASREDEMADTATVTAFEAGWNVGEDDDFFDDELSANEEENDE